MCGVHVAYMQFRELALLKFCLLVLIDVSGGSSFGAGGGCIRDPGAQRLAKESGDP